MFVIKNIGIKGMHMEINNTAIQTFNDLILFCSSIYLIKKKIIGECTFNRIGVLFSFLNNKKEDGKKNI